MKKKLLYLLLSVVFCTISFTNNLSALAAPVVMPDGNIFDAEYYAGANPDVASILGTDANALYQHYISYGKAEGRTPYNPLTDVSALASAAANTVTTDSALRASDSSLNELRTALPGTYITFGAYEQDNKKKNGQEPIEWLVLENTGESLFVTSKYALDAQPYSTAYDQYTYNPYPITWEHCNLRAWYNSTFYETAFDAGEQARIKTVNVDNTIPSDIINFVWEPGVTGGNNTLDKVFALSYAEVEKYFPMQDTWIVGDGDSMSYNKLLQIQPTAYAIAQGAQVWSKKTADSATSYNGYFAPIAYDIVGYAEQWSLRTPAYSQTCYFVVNSAGSFGYDMVAYDSSNRPAIVIDLK